MCPLRFLVAILSMLLLLWSGFHLFVLSSEAAEKLEAKRRAKYTTWWRLVVSFFSGEYIYDFFGNDDDAVTSSCTVPLADADSPRKAATAGGDGSTHG